MKVSVIGLGIMGSAVVKKLLSGGLQVVVHNRSRQKAELLIASGAQWAVTPAEAAREADIVITLVKDPAAASDVTLGANGILAGIRSESVHAEMSTISPQAAQDFARHYKEAGKRYVQAPVLGSKKQIEDATLLIMAGGATADIENCQHVWQNFAKRTWHLESASQAAAMKLSCNMLIAQMILGLGQSLVFAQNYGVNPHTFLEVIEQSALNSPMYQSKGQAFVSGNFQPNFTVQNMLKDIALAEEAAEAVNCKLKPNKVAHELFKLAIEKGFGGEDYSAVIKAIAEEHSLPATSP